MTIEEILEVVRKTNREITKDILIARLGQENYLASAIILTAQSKDRQFLPESILDKMNNLS